MSEAASMRADNMRVKALHDVLCYCRATCSAQTRGRITCGERWASFPPWAHLAATTSCTGARCCGLTAVRSHPTPPHAPELRGKASDWSLRVTARAHADRIALRFVCSTCPVKRKASHLRVVLDCGDWCQSSAMQDVRHVQYAADGGGGGGQGLALRLRLHPRLRLP